MLYFDEMLTKYGFSDGGSVPVGLDAYREVYIKCVNFFAEKRRSNFRAIPYDRFGIHNSCLILFEEVSSEEKIEKELHSWDVVDDAMREAVCDADDLYPDGFVEIVVSIDHEGLEDALVNGHGDEG